MTDLFNEIERELESSYADESKVNPTENKEYMTVPKKQKKPLSEVAKRARIANLQKGRELRKNKILERKRIEQMYAQYQDEDEESEDEQKFKPKLPQKGDGSKKVQRLELELEAMKNVVSKLSKKKEKDQKQPVIINNQLPGPYTNTQPQQSTENRMSALLKKRILKF